MKERDYQPRMIRRLKSEFPNCIVLKNDSNYMQGIPDLLVLYKDRWAMLECKTRANAPQRPNQKYFIEKANSMSYGAFIFPENEEVVFDELHSFFDG